MITAKTRVCAVLGHPVAHSMSPAIHNAAFNELGLDFVYVAFDVEDVRPAIDAMREMGIKGYSVTIPHKQAVLPLMDKVDSLAEKIGAVNTVVNSGGKLEGFNTDAFAAASALEAKTSLGGKKVALLGAGGAARAIAFALFEKGSLVTILNRTALKAEALSKEVGCAHAFLNEMASLDFDILINATSIGMHPKVDASPVDKSILKKGMLVFDVVYNPVETLLLKQAKQAGCGTVSGVEMFVGQGAEQFRLWTGKNAPVELMRKVVLGKLGK